MKWSKDGQVLELSREEALPVIKILRSKGFKYRNGIWSSNWDRLLGEWVHDIFQLNGSIIYKLEEWEHYSTIKGTM